MPTPTPMSTRAASPPYADDTSEMAQRAVAAPPPAIGMMTSESIGRCDTTEDAEAMANGNGLLGHDETSEDWSVSFQIFTTPSPGTVNSCP